MPTRQPPQILCVETLTQTRIFRVERLDLRFSNGKQMQYERITGTRIPREEIGAAVLIVPVLDNGDLVLIREYSAGTERYELSFPKGGLEPGEDPLDCANREIQEEIGFAANDLTLLRSVSVSPGYIRHMTHIVLARGLYESSLPGDEPEEMEQLRWPLSKASELLNDPDLTDTRTIAALLLTKETLNA